MGRVFDATAAPNAPKVHEVRTLNKANDTEAKRMLHDIARQVQPILHKRNWAVPLLSEFYPKNHCLLGLNIGGGGGRTREIRIRLRKPHDETSFYHYESVLCTMLHELVHNVRGPHDSVFYKLLDELKLECEELMAKGISGTGQGFDAPSVGCLGTHGFLPTHNPPASQLKNHILKAAEDRAKRQRIMPHGPCKLGGDVTGVQHLTPAQAAAQAALRRQLDNVWCPCERLTTAWQQGEHGVWQQQQQQQQVDADAEERLVHIIEDGTDNASQAGGGISDTQQQQQQQRQQEQQQQQRVGESSGVTVNHNHDSNIQKNYEAGSTVDERMHKSAAQTVGDVVDLTGDDDNDLIALPCVPGMKMHRVSWTCHVCTFLNDGGLQVCEMCASATTSVAHGRVNVEHDAAVASPSEPSMHVVAMEHADVLNASSSATINASANGAALQNSVMQNPLPHRQQRACSSGVASTSALQQQLGEYTAWHAVAWKTNKSPQKVPHQTKQ